MRIRNYKQSAPLLLFFFFPQTSMKFYSYHASPIIELNIKAIQSTISSLFFKSYHRLSYNKIVISTSWASNTFSACTTTFNIGLGQAMKLNSILLERDCKQVIGYIMDRWNQVSWEARQYWFYLIRFCTKIVALPNDDTN